MSWTGWLFMAASAVALWAFVVLVVVGLFRGTRSGAARANRLRDDADACRILDQRFARGEIDVQEYRARREVLHTAR